MNKRVSDLRAIRRDLDIILNILTASPEQLAELRMGKTLEDLRRDKAAELTVTTGDKRYVLEYLEEKVARRKNGELDSVSSTE